jgi:streptogramin lyase
VQRIVGWVQTRIGALEQMAAIAFAAAAICAVGYMAVAATAAAPVGNVTEFSAGITHQSPLGGITNGPDGNLWFTEYDNTIGRISPAGQVTEFSTGITGYPSWITLGPDGNLWFTEVTNRIGRITPSGEVTEFSAGISPGSRPWGITSGPDGNLWFAEAAGNSIGRITPAGEVTEFSVGLTAGASPTGITTGPDGNLWFTEQSRDKIGRITPGGLVTEFSTGITPGAGPLWITSGPDGNLWFTEANGGRVGRITPSGEATEFSAGITTGTTPYVIAAGPDGNLWFTEEYGHQIGRITPAGQVTEFSAGITSSPWLYGISAGADHSLWFTESFAGTAGRIGRISTLPSADLTIGVGSRAIPPSIGFNVAGTLSDPNPVAAKTLLVEAIPASGPAQTLGHPVTGADGSYTISAPAGLAQGRWTLRVTFDDPEYLLAAASVTLDVGTGSAAIAIDRPGGVVAVGRPLTLTGRANLGPGNDPGGRLVHLTAMSPTGASLTLGDVHTASDGAFALTLPSGLSPMGRWTISCALEDAAFLPASDSVQLDVGKGTATLTLNGQMRMLPVGRGFTLSGRLILVTGGAPAGRAIHLTVTSPKGTVRALTDARTTSIGVFSLALPHGLPSVGRWTIRGTFDDPAFLPVTRAVVFTIGITPAMRVATSARTVGYGRSIRVTVITGAWASGKLIYLYQTPYGRTYRLLARVRVPRSGRFTVTTKPANRAVYFAKYLGDSIRLPGSSPGVMVRVKFAITHRAVNATNTIKDVAIFKYHATCTSRAVGCPVFRVNIGPRLRGVPIRMEAAVNFKGRWYSFSPATFTTYAGGVLYVYIHYDASLIGYTLRGRATALGSFGLESSTSPWLRFRITR